jgi:hypothetical protein
VEIIAALFVDNFALRQVEGPSTRIDITGAYFSQVVAGPLPAALSPHVVVLIFCPPEGSGQGALEVVFRDAASPERAIIARNVSPFTVEPGKFTYRLVRGELEVTKYGRIDAECRINDGPIVRVPLTLLAPPSAN